VLLNGADVSRLLPVSDLDFAQRLMRDTGGIGGR
jgi:hypothetical protein